MKMLHNQMNYYYEPNKINVLCYQHYYYVKPYRTESIYDNQIEHLQTDLYMMYRLFILLYSLCIICLIHCVLSVV